jgi:hypothetical protein
LRCPLHSYPHSLTTCPIYRFLIKIPYSYPLDAAGPTFCATIATYSPLAYFTLQVPGQDTGQLPTGRGGSNLLCRNHHVLTTCPLYRFLVKIPDSYPLDAAGPTFCATIATYSPLAYFTLQVPGQDTGQLPTGCGGSHLLCRNRHVLAPCSLYRFLVRIPDSYPLDAAGPIFCAAITMYSPLATVQVPGQDTGQLPAGRGGSHLLCRHHHVLTFGHCTGSWSRYRTATHWTRRVPSSVPQSPCTRPLLTGRCVIAASLKLQNFVLLT